MKKLIFKALLTVAIPAIAQQNGAQGGCQGPFTTKLTNTNYTPSIGWQSHDTIPLGYPLMVFWDQGCPFNQNPNLMIAWYRNDTLLSTVSPPFSIDMAHYRYYVSLTPTLPGKYVGWIDTNYLPGYSSTDVTVSAPANGIISNKTDELKCYPNPSRGDITLVCAKEISELRVFDMLGKEVSVQKPQSKDCQITIEKEGVYFLRVVCGNEIFNKRLVVNTQF